MGSKPHAESALPTGQTILFDAEHLENVSKYKWVFVMRRDKAHVITRSRGYATKAMFLGRLLFKYRSGKEMIAFKNGNRLDFRSENVEIIRKGSYFKNTRLFNERLSAGKEVRMNGCVLRQATEGTRCDNYMECKGADACLDYVSHNTEWDGWDAVPAG